MERQRQLHHPQVRSEMPAIAGQDGDQFVPDFFRQLVQLRERQLLDVLRTVHHLEILAHNRSLGVGVMEYGSDGVNTPLPRGSVVLIARALREGQ